MKKRERAVLSFATIKLCSYKKPDLVQNFVQNVFPREMSNGVSRTALSVKMVEYFIWSAGFPLA